MSSKRVPIPAPYDAVFYGGINHPLLWLWDSWTLRESETDWHLYCLALSKRNITGELITPPERNDYGFHVRHFRSQDSGRTWSDLGALMKYGQVNDGADSRNIWSGSVLRLDDDDIAFGFTGVRGRGTTRPFLQSICIARGSDPGKIETVQPTSLSCPERDYDDIRAKGYYLGPRGQLGHVQGEEGGPILAWRDPFLFKSSCGELHAVWSAKLSPTIPAIAHARLGRETGQFLVQELYEPIKIPDAHLMTQAEVPKVYTDPVTGDYLMMISACDRQYEGQPDSELTHVHRLYRSANLSGPWRAYDRGGSALPGLEGMFGASLVSHDAAATTFKALGPYTENSGPAKQLTFANVVDVPIRQPRLEQRADLA